MHFRKLGSSDIEISEVSLGSWLTYSGGVEREQAKACVDAAFEAGINFIDTANVYGGGAAETLLGEVLSGRERSSYVLATSASASGRQRRSRSRWRVQASSAGSLANRSTRCCGARPRLR
jgi:aryl-alcohol dehydrogenase-like predicted oxidoreductase